MARADRDSLMIQDRADVVRMYSVKNERQDAGFLSCRADDSHTIDRRECVRRISEQLMLISGYCVQPDLTQIVDRRTKPDDACDIGSSCFEFVWQPVVMGLLEGDCAYHVAAALVWRHGFKQVGLPVQNTDTGGTKQLVTGECVKIAIKILDIYPHMRHCLRPIDQNRDVAAVRYLDDLPNRVDGAERVRHVHHGNQFCPLVQEPLVLVEEQLTIVVEGDDTESRANLLA